MNAAALLVNPTVNQKANVTNHPLNNQQNNSRTNPFAELLNSALGNGNSTVSTQSEMKKLTAVPNVSDKQGNLHNIEEMLAAFEQLLEMLPMEDGFIDPEMLQNPEVAALLNQMPPQIQQLLTSFIQSGQSFELLLDQTKKGSQEQLGLILLTLYQLEKKDQLPADIKQNNVKFAELVKVIQQQINEVFKVQMPEQSNNSTILISKLIQTLEKKNTVDSGQNVMPNKIELKQIIQRVLYSSPNNENTGNQQGTQKEQIGTQTVLSETTTKQVLNEDVFDQLVASSIKDGGSVNRIQQYVLNVGQASGSATPEDQILDQLKNIMKQSKFSTAPNGTNQLLIKLNPAHLGSLTIKLTEANGEMIARIIASSATAKDVIESNLNGLRHVFTTQNINVEKFEIQYQGENPFEDASRGNSQEQDQSKHKQQEVMHQNNNDDDSLESNSFKDELVNMMV